VTRPFSRPDAAQRARYCRYEADTHRGSVTERQAYAESAETEEDRRAAEQMAEIARRRVAFSLECAEAYERIWRGEEP